LICGCFAPRLAARSRLVRAFFQLFFSPFGTVGRSVFWSWALLYGAAISLLGVYAMRVADAITGAGNAKELNDYFTKWSTAPADVKAPEMAFIHAHTIDALIYVVVVATILPVLLWITFVIEVKRWHDRGRTGGCVVLYLLPLPIGYYAGPEAGAGAAAVIGIWRLVELGFLGEGDSFRYRLKDPVKGRLDSVCFSDLTVGLICLATLALLVGGYVAAQPLIATPASPSPMTIEAMYHGIPGGRVDKDFAKDWVNADGTTYTGITNVVVAAHGQVTISYNRGGTNITASELPQGFLDLWGINADMLRRANQP
jgi:uncharacterized membrane protein YhaH (DUF805 family)